MTRTETHGGTLRITAPAPAPLIGCETLVIDPKWRLVVPVWARRQFGSHCLLSVRDGRLWLSGDRLPLPASAWQVIYPTTGRVFIPPALRHLAGLQRRAEVILRGRGTAVEVVTRCEGLRAEVGAVRPLLMPPPPEEPPRPTGRPVKAGPLLGMAEADAWLSALIAAADRRAEEHA